MSEEIDCIHCDGTGEVRYLNDETDFGPCPYCQPEPEPSQAEMDECWERNRAKLARGEMFGLV